MRKKEGGRRKKNYINGRRKEEGKEDMARIIYRVRAVRVRDVKIRIARFRVVWGQVG